MKYIVTGHGKKVARVVDGVEERIADCGTAATPDECTANAILVASALNAAPALLAACEALLATRTDDPEATAADHVPDGFESCGCDWCGRLKAAIAAVRSARAAIALAKKE